MTQRHPRSQAAAPGAVRPGDDLPPPPHRTGRRRPDAGFSLVELMVAIILLTLGLLGMAAISGHVIRSGALSEIETQRAAIFQAAVEEVRSIPFEEVASGSRTIQGFTVRWEADPSGATAARTKLITVTVTGPGRVAGPGLMGAMASDVEETYTYRLIRRDPR